MMKTFDVKLDIEKELYFFPNTLFTVSREDLDSIELHFEITQDGAAMDLTGTTVEIAIKKPSGYVVYQEMEITDAVNGKATSNLAVQAYAEYGIYTAEVYVRTETQLAVTSPFYYSSRESILEGETAQSGNDWSAIQEALFSMDKKPILVDGIPSMVPDYVGQMAFDTTGSRAFIANDTVADSWQLLAASEGGGGGIVYWADIQNKPATYPPESHTHAIEDVTGLQTALDDAGATEPVGWVDIQNKPTTFPAEAHTHLIADVTDLQTELDGKADDADLAAKADATHSHAFADITNKPATYPADAHTHGWTEITAKPTTFTPESHTHAIADVTNLQTTLDGKADDTHSHGWTEITNKPTTFTPPAEYLTQTEGDNRYALQGSDGGTVEPAEWGQITGDITLQTDLQTALDGKADDADLTGKADANHSHGWTEITDKPTEFPAETHTHGWIDITNKPTAFTPESHTHAIADVTNLQTELDGKADTGHSHAIADVTNLQTTLDGKADDADLTGKADAVHTHAITDVTNLQTELDGKADSTHAHAFADITDKPATYPADAHTHGWTEITNKPTAFPAESHTHVIADVTDLQTSLDAKADTGHSHAIADVTNLQTELDGKADNADIPDTSGLQEKALSVTAAPTTAPEFEGQMAVDSTNERTYIAEGTTVDDWKRLAETSYVDTGDNYIMNTRMNGLTLWNGTQADYDAIATKDPNTLYFITG
jgi:hypothetical protein